MQIMIQRTFAQLITDSSEKLFKTKYSRTTLAYCFILELFPRQNPRPSLTASRPLRTARGRGHCFFDKASEIIGRERKSRRKIKRTVAHRNTWGEKSPHTNVSKINTKSSKKKKNQRRNYYKQSYANLVCANICTLCSKKRTHRRRIPIQMTKESIALTKISFSPPPTSPQYRKAFRYIPKRRPQSPTDGTRPTSEPSSAPTEN